MRIILTAVITGLYVITSFAGWSDIGTVKKIEIHELRIMVNLQVGSNIQYYCIDKGTCLATGTAKEMLAGIMFAKVNGLNVKFEYDNCPNCPSDQAILKIVIDP